MSRLGCAWAVTALLGITLVGLGVLGLFDPQGAQAANDPDPFGTPPGRSFFIFQLTIGLALILWPVPRLYWRSRRAKGPG